jgi:uncharacterized membrane protein HdeD (DUF308 family)
MAAYIYQNRWLIGLRGALAILFGIIAFLWPEITVVALVYLFAAYAIFDGVLSIIAAFRNRATNDRWWLGLLEGLIDIAAGVVAFLFPTMAAVVAVFVVAFWAIATGILEIAAAIQLRKEIQGEWALALTGVVSIVLGVIMIIFPSAGLIGLVWAIAGYAIVFGALMIYLAVTASRKAAGAARVYESQPGRS